MLKYKSAKLNRHLYTKRFMIRWKKEFGKIMLKRSLIKRKKEFQRDVTMRKFLAQWIFNFQRIQVLINKE